MTSPNTQAGQTVIRRQEVAGHGTFTAAFPSRAAHDPVGVYEQCRCDPADIGYGEGHFAVDGVGLTCDRGLLFHVCAICCADEVVCSHGHSHGPAAPACPRIISPVAMAS
ncbi:MAG: hypothetical protein JST91_12780 [Actinobacteria bacterium]|nr:hypothetical protein [Actinomycetota bacterium]